MEEISVDEFKKRAEDLIRRWQIGRKKELDLKLRRLDLDAETALVSLKYIPYILATIYYSLMDYEKWLNHKAAKEEEKLNVWADKSIDRILSLAPSRKIDKENFRNDIQELTNKMKKEVDLKNPTLASDILSDKIFKVLQKYCPEAESRDRELVDYIVRAELASLKG